MRHTHERGRHSLTLFTHSLSLCCCSRRQAALLLERSPSLIEARTDADRGERTPLLALAANDSKGSREKELEMARMLLGRGARAEARDTDGESVTQSSGAIY